MTDNTQAELDAVLGHYRLKIHKERRNPYAPAVIADANRRVLDWHNKQIEAVLDRIHQRTVRGDIILGEPAYMAVTRAINTERNRLTDTDVGKLKESK